MRIVGPNEAPQETDPYEDWLLAETIWLPHQMLEELKSLTVKGVHDFHLQILAQRHVELLVHGNMSVEEALRATDLVQNVLGSEPLPIDQCLIEHTIVPPPVSDYTYRYTSDDPHEVHNCIGHQLHIGANIDSAVGTILLLWAEMARQPVYDRLAKKKQLGDNVSSRVLSHNTLNSWEILVYGKKSC